MNTVSMDTIISLAKRRGFIFSGSEIYGGLANSWDYGPLGVELKNHIKQEWWKRFVHGRADIVGIDAALIMNPKVWEASGHLSKFFGDMLTECRQCHSRYRADQIDTAAACEKCGAQGSFTEPTMFNTMLQTFLGPKQEDANRVFFRPETAQAMFVNFKQVLETTRRRLPFGIAQVGKAFRNEITPGNFIFRTREFEQMEIEYFIREGEWEKTFDAWLEEMLAWIEHLGISRTAVHIHEIAKEDRAHYSKRTVDLEYDFPFGRSELYGLAYRTDFDLKNHASASGIDLVYTDPDSGEKFVPHVVEPTWGVDRTVLAVMLSAYTQEDAPTADKGETDTRVVMKFPYWLAPYKAAILPLSKKEPLVKLAHEIEAELRKSASVQYDETGSIGKRYRRQDEIGTPLCITVDFDSLKDNAITVRDRDTMRQERVAISELPAYLQGFTNGLV